MSKEELDATDVLLKALFRLQEQGITVAGDLAERMMVLVDDLAAAGLLQYAVDDDERDCEGTNGDKRQRAASIGGNDPSVFKGEH